MSAAAAAARRRFASTARARARARRAARGCRQREARQRGVARLERVGELLAPSPAAQSRRSSSVSAPFDVSASASARAPAGPDAIAVQVEQAHRAVVPERDREPRAPGSPVPFAPRPSRRRLWCGARTARASAYAPASASAFARSSSRARLAVWPSASASACAPRRGGGSRRGRAPSSRAPAAARREGPHARVAELVPREVEGHERRRARDVVRERLRWRARRRCARSRRRP